MFESFSQYSTIYEELPTNLSYEDDYNLELDLINSFKNLTLVDMPKFAPKKSKKSTYTKSQKKFQNSHITPKFLYDDGTVNWDFFTIGLNINKPPEIKSIELLTPPQNTELIIHKLSASNQYYPPFSTVDSDSSSSDDDPKDVSYSNPEISSLYDDLKENSYFKPENFEQFSNNEEQNATQRNSSNIEHDNSDESDDDLPSYFIRMKDFLITDQENDQQNYDDKQYTDHQDTPELFSDDEDEIFPESLDDVDM